LPPVAVAAVLEAEQRVLFRLALDDEREQLERREEHPDADGDRQEHLAVEAIDEDEQADDDAEARDRLPGVLRADAAHQQQVREGPAAVERIGRQEEVEGEEDDVELDLFWILDLCCF